MPTPAELATKIEAIPAHATGTGDRFTGYSVMSCPFASGNILAMRRFPSTSVGPGYTSVWHRDPNGRWTFYQDQPATGGCSRYFGPALHRTVPVDIDIEWTGPSQFAVYIDGGATLDWRVRLQPTLTTKALNRIGATLPQSWWESSAFLEAMGKIAAATLRSGKLNLAGQAPNGQNFVANPKNLWTIADSTAELDGHDLGTIGAAGRQARLGDFWIPTRGLFTIGDAFFETAAR